MADIYHGLRSKPFNTSLCSSDIESLPQLCPHTQQLYIPSTDHLLTDISHHIDQLLAQTEMDQCSNHDHSSCPATTTSVHQTLDEMDFERGIWSAALSGDLDKTRELLNKGTNPDAEDKSGYTALHYAARCGHVQICSLLLKNGASVNKKTRAGGATALHRAAMTGNYEMCQILMNFKADIGAKDIDNRTPLHRAVEGGHSKIITLFLQTDPSVGNIKDNLGRTPYDLASQKDSLLSLFVDH